MSRYHAMRRRQSEALGLCTSCRKTPRVAGATKCEPCRDRQRAYMRAVHATRNPSRCSSCNNSPLPGKRLCARCNEAVRVWSAANRKRRVASMRCIRCGRNVAHAEIKTCAICDERCAHNHRIVRALRHG